MFRASAAALALLLAAVPAAWAQAGKVTVVTSFSKDVTDPIKKAFEKAVRKAAQGNDATPKLFENRLSYILTTGGNWATGSIGRFRLTIDKGRPDSLVSFCGTNVKKTGPTTFEMTAEDFFPERDIDILLLDRRQDDGTAKGNGG